jgi:hypothetical protein
MTATPTDILILRARIAPAELSRLVASTFGDMVKYVVDLERQVIAIGGQLHADAEGILLVDGSAQSDLWGANYYPGRGPEACIEFTSMINIRPAQGNLAMEIQDPTTRERLRELTFRLVGAGEAL